MSEEGSSKYLVSHLTESQYLTELKGSNDTGTPVANLSHLEKCHLQ